METVEQFAGQVGLEVIYRDEYDVVNFLREVAFRESNRCHYCYHLRLNAAAKLAKKSRMDGFTTTLLSSKGRITNWFASSARKRVKNTGSHLSIEIYVKVGKKAYRNRKN